MVEERIELVLKNKLGEMAKQNLDDEISRLKVVTSQQKEKVTADTATNKEDSKTNI